MHVVLWEFRVRPGHEQEFERAYGPRGLWEDLFRQGEGYMGTELFRDLAERKRYLTIDRWSSRAAFESFRARHLGEYEALDRHCSVMTESETQVGSFSCVSAPVPD